MHRLDSRAHIHCNAQLHLFSTFFCVRRQVPENIHDHLASVERGYMDVVYPSRKHPLLLEAAAEYGTVTG
jgi:hypothetical protein